MNNALVRLLSKAGWPYLEIWYSGVLCEYGWFRSRRERLAISRDGLPIPWFTYPAIHLLENRVRPDLRVFEYGGGQGSLWWAARSAAVAVVEHHAGWAAYLAGQGLAVETVGADEDTYSQSVRGRGPFDVIVVDGLYRPECVESAMPELADCGVLILDDTHRLELAPTVDRLRTAGWRWLPLRGPAPVSKELCETSLFFREGNWLGL